ncbi:hypothetical protein A1O1_00438 [Capronia coronata CBS 617.96]|uniref:Tr-type G domain-containing protein n=1 Tax=Capronia coronata CBS 617.96 TaxID=1182541 RepID=W9YRX5_9EURO|nr:uncharacterized protein A1O1_00438 [Capronia coronata CBS 617.96]EXJ95318.1 hypothetical protein A1O1_00438 [Capronia coronata CBS 617.96]
MASIFTFQDEPPRIQSPWSTPGTSSPQPLHLSETPLNGGLAEITGLTKLEPENQEGSTEYKLHLLLRPRRRFVSTSTAAVVLHPQHYLSQSIFVQQGCSSESSVDRSATSQPSAHARQARLQQLTTQLLWRLQQSSPFHSSSNAQLVLPVLPEATPRLGAPERPANLLPGLEESQGALYEIGVADDGTLVGLAEDELTESLTNLDAMAASLGCTTNVVRKVAVGSCQWAEDDDDSNGDNLRADKLWVAEVLVYPDSRESARADLEQSPRLPEQEDGSMAEISSSEQIRVTLVGATSAGKSSLLGTLSTSTLDNGRGKSRLSLLKHRHEIASGITSSVAQEIIGYLKEQSTSRPVINYASGNVSSWTDIHNLADRLVFLSDSPGLPRFAKSTLRSVISWKPSWTVLCVAADDYLQETPRVQTSNLAGRPPAEASSSESTDLSLSYLDLCLRLGMQLIITITKMDLANRTGLRLVLAKLLSRLKAAGRKPVMLNTSSVPPLIADSAGAFPELQLINITDQAEVDRIVATIGEKDGNPAVPILMTSAVTGSGISKLHALLRSVPIVRPQDIQQSMSGYFSLFHVDEVFSIPPSRVYSSDPKDRIANQGVVLCGYVSRGTLSIGNILRLGPLTIDRERSTSRSSQPIVRSRSYGSETPYAQRLMTNVARSYQGEGSRSPTARQGPAATTFLTVRVVSLRNLRLPVVRMQQGETGTIGVEPVNRGPESTILERARKGMVLVGDPSNTELVGYHSFSASFPSSDFARRGSPPLILGGHATAYINSVRAAVKVTGVALDEQGDDGEAVPASPDGDVFGFDADEGESFGDGSNDNQKEIRITFRFGSTFEWMETGDQVLVIPTVAAPGPVTGPAVSNISGLAGFVGRLREVFS